MLLIRGEGMVKMKKYPVYVVVKTGLHIGGLKDYEIGGIDNMVIKDPEGFPYIPGSSLKGKLRYLLEILGLAGRNISGDDVAKDKDEARSKPIVCDCGECVVCHTFGFSEKGSERVRRSKVLVSDFFIPSELNGDVEGKLGKKLPHHRINLSYIKDGIYPSDFIEVKPENSIVRHPEGRGKALNPRFTERVKPGTVFKGHIVILDKLKVSEAKEKGIKKLDKFKELYKEVMDNEVGEDENLYLAVVKLGLKLLEEYDSLGGSGSRGYGRVGIFLDEKGEKS